MSFPAIFLLVLAASVVNCKPSDQTFLHKFSDKKAVPAPRLTLDLDKAPCDRWKDIASKIDPKFFQAGIEALLSHILPTPEMVHMAEEIASKLDRFFQEPYSDELRCLSEASGVPLGDIILTNVFYDLTAYANSSLRACTSIVALNKYGEIIHGRNLDYVDPSFLKNVTVVIDFQRNGKTVYTAVSYLGYIGIMTGVRHGAFSLTGNARLYGSLYLNLLSVLEGAQLTFFTLRRVLDESSDYPSALNQATNTPTAAPVYFILGGRQEGEGALIVRNGRDVAVVKKLDDYQDHSWFLVETNYDPWLQPPKSDDRRDAAIKAMEKIGQENMDADQLYKVLSTPPVLNNQTTYTAIMSASNSSVFEAMIRYDAP